MALNDALATVQSACPKRYHFMVILQFSVLPDSQGIEVNQESAYVRASSGFARGTDMRMFLLLMATIVSAGLFSTASYAQLNNRPYSFGSGPIGMSKAGRQAIIDQKLDGATPDNMFRDQFGNLQSASRGPQGVPILTDRAGVQDIGKAGRSSPFRQGPGVFNSFFVKFGSGPRNGLYPEGSSSGAMIDGWTGNVQGFTTIGGNSVDVWTGMVYYLAR